jgi:hypothetical protein
MTAELSGDQVTYLSEWANMFGNGIKAPDQVSVEFRFVHRDASQDRNDPNSSVAHDIVVVDIVSSLEDASVYCDTDLATLAIESGTALTGQTFQYAIAAGETATRVEFDYNQVIDPDTLDRVMSICRDTIYYTVDIQNAAGTWETVYSTKNDFSAEDLAYLDGTKISVGINQDEFMNDIQPLRESLDQTINVPMKICVRNDRGVEIPALAADFTLSVTGNGFGAECGPATLTKRDGAKNGVIAVPDVVAGATPEFTKIEVLNTIAVDGDVATCKPVFFLLVKDNDSVYKPYQEFIEILEGEAGSQVLTSVWNFNKKTGDFSLDLSSKDVALFRARFTTAGVTKMEFKVQAMQPGSTTVGPLINRANLPFADFEYVIEDQAAIDACVQNRLIKTDLTKDDVSRTKTTFDYRIAKAGETDETLVIGGLNVRPDVSENNCPLVRRIEYYSAVQGRFVEARTRDGGSGFFTRDDTNFKLTFAVTQTQFMDDILPMFV